jgi:hypothetical protein
VAPLAVALLKAGAEDDETTRIALTAIATH